MVGQQHPLASGSVGGASGADDDSSSPSQIRVQLEEKERELWVKFHELTNEMIVTKMGRYAQFKLKSSWSRLI